MPAVPTLVELEAVARGASPPPLGPADRARIAAARLRVNLPRSRAEAGRLTIDLEHPDLAGETEDLALAAATCASAGVVRPRG